MNKRALLLLVPFLILISVVVFIAVVDSRQGGGLRRRLGESVLDKALLGARGGLPKSSADGKIVVRQVSLPKLGRVDRCITCHSLEAHRARAELAERSITPVEDPLGIHSWAITKYHSVEKFGCTVCHGGRGYALTADAAHGRAEPWQTPMLPTRFIQASCGRCHKSRDCPNAPLLNRGRRLFAELGCVGCHKVADHGQNFGPDLTNIGDKDVNHDYKLNNTDWLWLVRHFEDPKSLNPDSYMPNFGLTDEDALALTSVVLSFRGAEIPDEYIVPDRAENKQLSVLEKGKLVFVAAGCAGCHGRGGHGGVRNPNMRGGEIPALATMADTIVANRREMQGLIELLEEGVSIEEKKEEPWLRAYFTTEERILKGRKPEKEDPRGDDPPLFMPSWDKSVKRGDLHYLVAYIISLFPDDAWEDWDAEKMEN